MEQDNQLMRELIEEENASLKLFMEGHLRWARLTDETTLAFQHQTIAETLTNRLNETRTLIESLQAG